MDESEKVIADQMQHIVQAALTALPKEQIMTSARMAAEEASRVVLEENRDSFAKLSATIADFLKTIPPDAMVSVEETTALVEEVRPYLPEEVAEAVESRIKAGKRSSGQIPLGKIMEIVTFIICVLTFAKDCLPDECQQRQEASNSVIIANQEEMLRLQREEAERSEKFRQQIEDACERFNQSLEMLVDEGVVFKNDCQQVVNVPEFSDDLPEQKALNKTDDGQK